MYRPKLYNSENREEALAFMKSYFFASVISSNNDIPTATHIPLYVGQDGGEIYITGHFSKSNEHWKIMEERKCLVIFNQPHAYISPSHYNKRENVPTWNYTAVHAYGSAIVHHSNDKKEEILQQMFEITEPSYALQWKELPSGYKSANLNGIVAFEIVVEELQFAKKLSQNKRKEERGRIISALLSSSDQDEAEIARLMRQEEND